jgi:hypothetical protein
MMRLCPIKYGVKTQDGSDPYSSGVLSLLHADSFNGDTTFIDNGLDAGSWLAAAPYISTTQSQFGGSSFRCVHAADYITAKVCTTTWNPNTPYTAEGWFYYDGANSGVNKLFFNAHYNSGSQCVCELEILATSHNLYFSGSAFVSINTGIPMPINTWSHLSVSSTGSAHYLYLNGVMIASATGTNTISGTLYWAPMSSQRGGIMFGGYMDEVRLTYGYNRYPSGTTFAVPTQAFPNP